MSYQAPNSILQVLNHIEHEEALKHDDPRYVDTREARGSQKTLSRLARKFGLDLNRGDFLPPTSKHVLFFGHTGSGKTTELRHYAAALGGPGRYLVVEVEIAVELDLHNLQYADTLMAMARSLLNRLEGEKEVELGHDALKELETWFSERVLSSEEAREFAAKIESGAQVKGGIPYLVELFSKATVAFKTNATYKDSMRRVIRNTFSEFAVAFNRLLRQAEEALEKAGKARRVLFVIDGTDKLRGEDQSRFFVQDAEQLLAIEAHVIYTAPLSLKYEGNTTGKLDDLVLPMVKLYERDGARCEAGWSALRELILRRADRALFAGEGEIARLIEHSGGHPRELLRLLKLCCEFAEDDLFDAGTVEAAIKQLAAEYRRFLEPEDYTLLAAMDHQSEHGGNDERTRRLLYHLALLEYNDGSWRRSHPVVRRLEGYVAAQAKQASGG